MKLNLLIFVKFVDKKYVFFCGFLAVMQTDSFCSIQQTEQLYRQRKVVSIDDDVGGCLMPMLL